MNPLMQVVFLAQAVTPLPPVVTPVPDAGAVHDVHVSDAAIEVVVVEDADLEPSAEAPTQEEIIEQALLTLRLIEETTANSNADGVQ